jgi:hypothetical protein
MSSTSGKGKKKATFNPEIPPFQTEFRSSPPVEQELPFAPHNTAKRPRSNTTTSLRDFTAEMDPKQYWYRRLMDSRKKGSSKGEFTITLLTTCLTDFLLEIQQDYTNKCSQLSEHINTLQDENATMAAAINHLGEKTTFYLGSSSPAPEDSSLRQEVGSFRSHTIFYFFYFFLFYSYC